MLTTANPRHQAIWPGSGGTREQGHQGCQRRQESLGGVKVTKAKVTSSVKTANFSGAVSATFSPETILAAMEVGKSISAYRLAN